MTKIDLREVEFTNSVLQNLSKGSMAGLSSRVLPGLEKLKLEDAVDIPYDEPESSPDKHTETLNSIKQQLKRNGWKIDELENLANIDESQLVILDAFLSMEKSKGLLNQLTDIIDGVNFDSSLIKVWKESLELFSKLSTILILNGVKNKTWQIKSSGKTASSVDLNQIFNEDIMQDFIEERRMAEYQKLMNSSNTIIDSLSRMKFDFQEKKNSSII